MSAHEVTYYQVQCDCCGQICDEYGDFSALSLPGYARDERPDGWAGIGDEDFCEDCWKWSDDEDEEVRAHETHPKEPIMTERIDHAGGAMTHIEYVHEWQGEAGDMEETQLANAFIAQAEATLALVEQQRIANLLAIACGTSEGAMSTVARDLAYMTLIENGPDGMIRPEIAAALGIGAQS